MCIWEFKDTWTQGRLVYRWPWRIESYARKCPWCTLVKEWWVTPQRPHCRTNRVPRGAEMGSEVWNCSSRLHFLPSSFLSFYPFDLHFLKIILSKLQVCYGRTKFLKRVSVSYSGKAQEQREGNRARPVAATEQGMEGWGHRGGRGAGWSRREPGGLNPGLCPACVFCFVHVCICSFLRWQEYMVCFLGYVSCHGFGISFHLTRWFGVLFVSL